MLWYEDEGLRTHAGFALHAAKLLRQYDRLAVSVAERERYDVTLTLCVLQSLLTNYKELSRSIEDNCPEWFDSCVEETPTRWGISCSSVTIYTFPKRLTYRKLAGHLRDALSHPTKEHSRGTLTTGYSVLGNALGNIEAVRFVHAPLTEDDGSQKRSRRKEEVESWIKHYRKHGVTVEDHEDGRWYAMREGKVFVPVMEIKLPISSLKTYAGELATVLAHPAAQTWDGKRRLAVDQIELTAAKLAA